MRAPLSAGITATARVIVCWPHRAILTVMMEALCLRLIYRFGERLVDESQDVLTTLMAEMGSNLSITFRLIKVINIF